MFRFATATFVICVLVGCQSGGELLSDRTAAKSRRLPNRDAIAALLPAEVKLDTVAAVDYGGANKRTVEDELIRVQARVGEDGKLRDGQGKPVQFFHEIGCWGNPPANYQQIQADHQRRFEDLRKTSTVITLTCNPSGIPIP